MAERYDFYVHDNRKVTFNLTEPIMREDSGVTDFVFHIPKILNDLEVSDWAWWLVFVNAKKEKRKEPLTLSDDPERPLEQNVATYTVGYNMSIKAGGVHFAIEGKDADAISGEVLHEWHTISYDFKVKDTLQGSEVEYDESQDDIISALITEIRTKSNALVGGATPEVKDSIAEMTDHKKIYVLSTDGNWYRYNGTTWVSGGQYASGIVIDPTLTQSGQSADAKVTGDEIANLKEDLIKTFATFSNDLYNAYRITNGEIVRTLGYYSSNDGGGSLYLITDTASSYSISLNHGLYANVIESQNVNAGAFGAIGQKDVSYARKAIAFAGSIVANIYFPSDINIGGGLEFGPEFNDRTIIFYGNVTYRGSLYAITLHNTKNVTVRGNELTCTGGSGIQILQDGEYTLYNTNVFFAYINAHIDGLRVTAKTWGVYECLIHVDKINSRYYGLRCEALESSTDTSSFVGQMKYEFQHLVSSETYAISFNAATNTTITGVLIDGLSLEGSHNGIQLRGDCKLFEILNVRALEYSSFTWLVNATGDLRFNRLSFTSPPKTDQLYINATQPEVVEPMVIEGGIYSPAQYRFADKAIYYNGTTVYGASNNNVYQKSENFTFGSSDATYRCYKNFINSSGSELTYDVLGYFSPFGVDEIFVTQNKNSGSVSIVKRGSNTIFDGNSVTEDGETTYKITAMYDPSLGSTIYKILRL